MTNLVIKAIGTGGFVSAKYGNTCLFITNGNEEESLLFDMGRNIIEQSKKIGFELLAVRNVFLSHMHNDHIGSTPDFAFLTHFVPDIKKVNLFIHSLMYQDYKAYLMSLVSSLDFTQKDKDKPETTIHDFFNVHSLKSNKSFKLGGNEFIPFQTTHFVNSCIIMPSFGLIIKTENGKKVLITGDTQFNPSQLKKLYNEADYIFHECETAPFESGIHSHINKLLTLPKEIRDKMYLTHYGDNIEDEKIAEKGKQFAGYVLPNQEIEIV